MKLIKFGTFSLLGIILLVLAFIYLVLRSSLATLDAKITTPNIQDRATLSRDQLGTAIITAKTQSEAAFLLGFAHAQDRLFQIDLLRRQAAGELSEIVGSRAIELDKKHRIHQFRKRAQNAYSKLSETQKNVLTQYTQGVNAGADNLLVKPFEYYLTSSEFKAWQAVDSLLVIYSMYIDLQLSQTERDFRLNALKVFFGEAMVNFFNLPSNYQSSIDYSVVPSNSVEIPNLQNRLNTNENLHKLSKVYFDSIQEQADYGSNNWAVSGKLTDTNSAMLSNDMHLGLRVPAIWYRAQLNYTHDNANTSQPVTVTGLSLPGTPGITVGSNGHIAWGFTNSNVDNVDWVKLTDDTPINIVNETIISPNGNTNFQFEMSEFGPVRELDGVKYALKWVAHQDYAVNLEIINMANMRNLDQGLAQAKNIKIPVQNMLIADSNGDIAWQLTGAITGRTNLLNFAIDKNSISPLWDVAETQPATQIRPENGRVWSANARVVSVEDLKRFGDGGYALGARQQQIMHLLMQKDNFSEQDFYDMQLNNKALFLMPWHNLLLKTLKANANEFTTDIEYLEKWQACACEDSIGYTLVRRFRSAVINNFLQPINTKLEEHDLSVSYLLKRIEPAVWQLIQRQPSDWLPQEYSDYSSFYTNTYVDTKERLFNRYSPENHDWQALQWGNVNQLTVKHPFSSSVGPLKSLLDMPQIAGFGDSYMPAVQANSFGASQRLIVRPGNENKGILTLPGGQSGHFLSKYYKKGFMEYVQQEKTPLLPTAVIHTIEFLPMETTSSQP